MHIHVDKTSVANSVQPVAHMYKKNNMVMYMYMYVRPSQTDCVLLPQTNICYSIYVIAVQGL